VERELKWDWWAGSLNDAAVSPAGRQTLSWAINVIRGFFGENWLADNAAQTGYVPLLNHQWWPLKNTRVVVRVLVLAARIALVTVDGTNSALVREAKNVYASRELAGTKFQHLCLALEVAAFAALAGWTVSYEELSISGRRPDLTVKRNATTYALEVTVLGLDREFRAIQRYCEKLQGQFRGLELHHGLSSCAAQTRS